MKKYNTNFADSCISTIFQFVYWLFIVAFWISQKWQWIWMIQQTEQGPAQVRFKISLANFSTNLFLSKILISYLALPTIMH